MCYQGLRHGRSHAVRTKAQGTMFSRVHTPRPRDSLAHFLPFLQMGEQELLGGCYLACSLTIANLGERLQREPGG